MPRFICFHVDHPFESHEVMLLERLVQPPALTHQHGTTAPAECLHFECVELQRPAGEHGQRAYCRVVGALRAEVAKLWVMLLQHTLQIKRLDVQYPIEG